MSRAVRAVALSLLTGSLSLAAAVPTDAAAPRPHGPATSAVRPHVSKVKPRTGSVVGGTAVTVKGANLAGATKVLFGHTKGTGLKVKNAHKLTVVAPAHAVGRVDVRVVTKHGKSPKTRKDRFTYAPPTVTGVAPATGSYVGGALVSVTGTGFAAGVTVTFGGLPGTAVAVTSSTSLVVTSPPHATGVVDVQVTSGSTTSVATAADRYTYALVPHVTIAPLPPGAKADGNVHLSDVDCAAGTRCTAVGYYHRGDGQSVPLVEQLVGTTWTATAPPLPPNTSSTPDGQLDAVSCPTTTFCVAVGVVTVGVSPTLFHAPLVETWSGSSWSIVSYPQLLTSGAGQPDPLVSVSCASATTCAAVGVFGGGKALMIWLDGGSWHSALPTLPPGATDASLASVDCGAEALCTAVGTYHDGAGDEPLDATLAADSWILAKAPLPADAAADPQAALTAIDCFSGTDCAAVGKYRSTTAMAPQLGLDEERTGNNWSVRAIGAPPSGDADPGIVLTSTSCPSDFCLAGGYFRTAGVVRALTVVITLGITPHEVLLPSGGGAGPDGVVSGVVCPEVERCAAVGTYTRSAARQSGLTTTLTGQPLTYSTALLPEPPGQKDLFLFGLSDDTPTTAVAVGNFTTTTAPSVQQGVLFTGVPVPAS